MAGAAVVVMPGAADIKAPGVDAAPGLSYVESPGSGMAESGDMPFTQVLADQSFFPKARRSYCSLA